MQPRPTKRLWSEFASASATASLLPVHEIAPGLWHWTARNEHIQKDVSSYYLLGERVLIDPMIPAATVDKKNLEIGHELMNLLQQRIQGILPAQSQHRMIKPEVIILQKS